MDMEYLSRVPVHSLETAPGIFQCYWMPGTCYVDMKFFTKHFPNPTFGEFESFVYQETSEWLKNAEGTSFEGECDDRKDYCEGKHYFMRVPSDERACRSKGGVFPMCDKDLPHMFTNDTYTHPTTGLLSRRYDNDITALRAERTRLRYSVHGANPNPLMASNQKQTGSKYTDYNGVGQQKHGSMAPVSTIRAEVMLIRLDWVQM